MSIRRHSLWTVASLIACGLTGCYHQPVAPAETQRAVNPYAPRYNHAYRHGAVPTREAYVQIRQWKQAQRIATNPNILIFGGGIDGIGVTSGTPRVYLVFYGSQWLSGGDPNGAATYLQNLFKGIGTGNEQWSGTLTQYCDGPTVPKGAVGCNPSTTPHVGYPSGGVLVGIWFDNAAPAPAEATTTQLAQEAVNAAARFGNTTPAANRFVQYIVVSPSGTHPDGFNTSSGNFCGWHNYTPSQYGDIAYTNMPYVTDAGASCGENFVNNGSKGVLDGFSIVNGHEYAETLTDQNPPGGWVAASGEEDGDECAWISSGQGAAANVTMGNGTYAMQSTWSNDTVRCDISHPIL